MESSYMLETEENMMNEEEEYFSQNITTDDGESVMYDNRSTNGTTNLTEMYCGSAWKEIGAAYASVHGYTSLIVCIFGCLANLLNLIVLTRKTMINPTNAILTGLALSDFCLMLEYIPYVCYIYIWKGQNSSRKTYGWALFVLLHSNFAQICHTISIMLTVLLAVWRYIMVAHPVLNKTMCTMVRAKWAILLCYVVPLILCTPLYLSFSISEKQSETNSSQIYYHVYYSNLALKNDRLLVTLNFWVYSVVIKIFPCILLTIVSLSLIKSLVEAKKRKEKLLSKKRNENNNSSESSADRTTRMLLAVLLLFLMTEFPQGILSAVSGALGDAFFKSCYIPLADILDFIALLNSSINFILYCAMSRRFREVFAQVFHLTKLTCDEGTSPSRNNITDPKTNVIMEGTPATQSTQV